MVYDFYKFRILYYDQKSEYYKIKQISILTKYIEKFGISSIRQIIFEFAPSHDFPYSHHNISLCNTQNQSFIVQFYHYYNSFNQLIILHEDIQKYDYYKLLQFFYKYPILQRIIVPYIHEPFKTT